jgi:hypothetical protein
VLALLLCWPPSHLPGQRLQRATCNGCCSPSFRHNPLLLLLLPTNCGHSRGVLWAGRQGNRQAGKYMQPLRQGSMQADGQAGKPQSSQHTTYAASQACKPQGKPQRKAWPQSTHDAPIQQAVVQHMSKQHMLKWHMSKQHNTIAAHDKQQQRQGISKGNSGLRHGQSPPHDFQPEAGHCRDLGSQIVMIAQQDVSCWCAAMMMKGSTPCQMNQMLDTRWCWPRVLPPGIHPAEAAKVDSTADLCLMCTTGGGTRLTSTTRVEY